MLKVTNLEMTILRIINYQKIKIDNLQVKKSTILLNNWGLQGIS